MSSLLLITHHLYWHKERLCMLEFILCSMKVNVGKLMQREIVACARRTVGSLFYPYLIRLLCEAENVPHLDQEEEEYPFASEIYFPAEISERGAENGKKIEEEREREKEKEGEKATAAEGHEVPYDSVAEVLLYLQQHMKKEEAVCKFLKSVYEWYSSEFTGSITLPSHFPDLVLSDAGPSEPIAASAMPTKPSTAVPPAPSSILGVPASATKSSAASKGKRVMLDSDEEDETVPLRNENEGSTSSTSPVSFRGDKNSKGIMQSEDNSEAEVGEKEESIVKGSEEDRERISKAETEKRRFEGNTRETEASAAVASTSFMKRPPTTQPHLLAPSPYSFADRSTWTSRKVVLSRRQSSSESLLLRSH